MLAVCVCLSPHSLCEKQVGNSGKSQKQVVAYAHKCIATHNMHFTFMSFVFDSAIKSVQSKLVLLVLKTTCSEPVTLVYNNSRRGQPAFHWGRGWASMTCHQPPLHRVVCIRGGSITATEPLQCFWTALQGTVGDPSSAASLLQPRLLLLALLIQSWG